MLPTEIERKFTINYLPNSIQNIYKITQKHIYRDAICSIRVRRSINFNTKDETYTHTIKTKGEKLEKFSTIELEREITKEQFEGVNPFWGSQTIEKYRIIIPLENGLKAEVDIFEKRFRGLIVAEVEFETIEQAENFKMPSWFEKEVSHKEFSNRRISTKSRHQILDLIGKKQLLTNEKILKDLKRQYRI